MKQVKMTAKTKRLLGVKSPAEDIDGMADENGLYGVQKEEIASVIEDSIAYLTAVRDGGQSEYHEDGLKGQLKVIENYASYKPYANMSEFKEAGMAVGGAIKDVQQAINSLIDTIKKYQLGDYITK